MSCIGKRTYKKDSISGGRYCHARKLIKRRNLLWLALTTGFIALFLCGIAILYKFDEISKFIHIRSSKSNQQEQSLQQEVYREIARWNGASTNMDLHSNPISNHGECDHSTDDARISNINNDFSSISVIDSPPSYKETIRQDFLKI